MEFLNPLFENAQLPFWSAFILGLMIATSPCPLATNITAIAYISKDFKSQGGVLINGLMYMLGQAVTYTSLGLLFYFGADQFNISGFLQEWGEKLVGPFLIVIGIFMWGWINFRLPGLSNLTDKLGQQGAGNYLNAFLLGLVLALAFCPYTGVLFFGILVPVTISTARGLYLPLVFAFAAGLPVIIFSVIIAFSLASIGKVYDRIKSLEFWFRRSVASLFILVGIYFIYQVFLRT